MMIIWLIGFLFSWGMVEYVKDKEGHEESDWDVVLNAIVLFTGWPFYLGIVASDILMRNEKSKKENE